MKPMMLCPMCKATKERKDFKRKATLSQTKAWLQKPDATKRMIYFGKECNECHKLTKRSNKDLTPNELQKRLINEGKNPLKVHAQVARRRAQGTKKKSVVASRTMSAYWKTKKSNNQEGE